MWNSNNNGYAGLLGRAGSYGPMFMETARRYGIPPEVLLSIGKIESNFNPRAVGPMTRYGQRAQGMMQFMSGTAKDMGLANPFDPPAAIDAGARYLSKLKGEFGDWSMAAAAYNAGPGNIKKWGRNRSRWPRETQNYVRQLEDYLGGGVMGSAFDGAALPAPPQTMAPSAGDGSAADLAGQSNIDPMSMGLLGAGLNMLTGNTGGASLGQLLGQGLTGAINAYGGALAAQQDQKRQGIDDQIKMMELAAKLREAENAQRQNQAYQTMEQTMSPVEYAKFIINPLEAIKGDREDWSHFDSSDDYGNKRSGLLNKRTGEVRYPGGGEGGQPAMDSLPAALQEGFAVRDALRAPAAGVQASQIPQAAALAGGGQGQVFTMDGQPVNTPAGARWQKPELTHLPDGTPVMRQYDTIGRHYRDMPAYDPKQESKTNQERSTAIHQNIVTEDIDRALALIDKNPHAVGWWGNQLKGLSGSSPHSLAALLQTIRANVGAAEINALRAGSGNGSTGLGAITEGEHRIMQALLGNLEQSLSQKEIVYNLKRLRKAYVGLINGSLNLDDYASEAGAGSFLGGSDDEWEAF